MNSIGRQNLVERVFRDLLGSRKDGGMSFADWFRFFPEAIDFCLNEGCPFLIRNDFWKVLSSDFIIRLPNKKPQRGFYELPISDHDLNYCISSISNKYLLRNQSFVGTKFSVYLTDYLGREGFDCEGFKFQKGLRGFTQRSIVFSKNYQDYREEIFSRLQVKGDKIMFTP